jgi:D-alanyl-D-alanine dipeptidase
MLKHNLLHIILLFSIIIFADNFRPAQAQSDALPEGFVYVTSVVLTVNVDLRYYSYNNFVGQRVDGYDSPKCILTAEAAEALKGVQNELKEFGLGLKIFDAYRPQQAVDHFVRWAGDLGDTLMKQQYYPKVDKKDLFKEGYIASKSGHSRGSTVDLTIVSIDKEHPYQELDMGSGWDFFGEQSWPDYPDITPSQRANRMLLKLVMEKYGFKPYDKEWWHFTLKNEPFPDTYFNFPIK